MEDQNRTKKDHSIPSDLQEHVPVNWFSNWEEQLLHEADDEPSYENQFKNCQRASDQRLWVSFQNAASSIAQLYKERLQNQECGWSPFQSSAASVTTLYKDAVDISRSHTDIAVQCGIQRRNKELLHWVRKKKRMIRREDLISFLCGRSPPHRSSVSSRSSKPSSPYTGNATRADGNSENDFQKFQEALSMHGLNGAMAGVSVHNSPNSRQSQQHRASPNRSNTHSVHNTGMHPDLATFIADEFRRRRNAPSPPSTSSTSGSRGRSNSPSVSSRKRHQSSETSTNSTNPFSEPAPLAKRSRK